MDLTRMRIGDSRHGGGAARAARGRPTSLIAMGSVAALIVSLPIAGMPPAAATAPTVAPPSPARAEGALTVPAAPGPVARGPRARKGLTVTGRVSNAITGMRVLLIAGNGSSASGAVGSDGRFTIRVSSRKAMRAFSPGGRGTGPSLHLTSAGVYAGPFVLARVKRKGAGRLAPTEYGTVRLGQVTLDPAGFVRLAKPLARKRIDVSHLMRLRKGVPVGAGTFGATGRLATTALRARAGRVPTGTVPPGLAGTGADADADGIPNVADVDMNGDEVLDAAQLDAPETTIDGTQLKGDEVLENRPFKPVEVIKILDTSRTAAVNSNVNTDLTWAELTSYLSDMLGIQATVESNGLRELFCPGTSAESTCAAAEQVAAIQMNCQTLSYCGSESQATINLGYPGLDRKPLREIALPDGAIPLYRPPNEPMAYYTMYFSPKVTQQQNLLFVGDTFEFVWRDSAGTELARRASVVTSSVAAAPEFITIGGQPYGLPRDSRDPVVITADQARALTVEFYRPQRLDVDAMTGPAPVLIDRGGLEYGMTVRTTGGDPSATGYFCRAEQVAPAGGGLVALEPAPGPGGSATARLYDPELNPSNGVRLSYTLDLTGCLTNPAIGPASAPAPGSTLTVELESFDTDGNRTRSHFFVRVA